MDRLLPTPDATHGRKDTRTSQLLPGVAEKFLPTPAASDVKGLNPREHKRDGELRTEADDDLPTRIARLLPTPTGQNSHGNDVRSDGRPLLPGAVRALLPTPRVSGGSDIMEPCPSSDTGKHGLDLGPAVGGLLRTPTAQLAVNGGSQHPDKRRAGGHQPTLADEVEHLLPTPQVADVTGRHKSRSGDRKDEPLLPGVVEQIDISPDQVIDWGPYAYAIYRWADTIGRTPPSPVEPGRNGKPRLSPEFVEWMQGLPEGWVTGVPKLSRNAQLKALGNGVVPQQAYLAGFVLLRRAPRWVQAQVSRAWQTQ